MDGYQKHLERQLQQQAAQLRNAAGVDMTSARLGNPPMLAPAAPAGRGIPGQPPQWPAANLANMNMSGVGPTQGNVSGFGRGLVGNPVGVNAPAAQHSMQQSLVQSQMNAFPSGPQGQQQQQQTDTGSLPRTKNQMSPAPNSPVIELEKNRIATILEINSHLIKLCLGLQPMVPAENIPQDPLYSGCLIRLQQNLAYLAAIADRAHKQESPRPLPHIQVLTAPPMIRTPEDKEALDQLYKVLSSLQPNSESVNGEGSGSESGSQVNSPQIRSRQTSAGSSQPGQGQQQPQSPQQHVPTPQMQRSQLPGHFLRSTPSPHLPANSLHGQSGLNPNPPQGIRPQPQATQPPFQPSFTQNPGFPLNQNPQFQQMAQQPAFQQQLQQLQQQALNQQFNPQNPSLPIGMQPQFQQFPQTPQNFPQQQAQQQPHLQPRAPSRPPSRPTSQHSATGPSPSISPRPLPHGASPQLTSISTPANSASPRVAMPNIPTELTPEQQAILQERMRLTREARIQQLQQQAAANRGNVNSNNLFPMSNGIPQQGNAFPSFPNPTTMNGTQNQNFGAGGGGE